MPKADSDWPDFPVILGFGSAHEMREVEQRSRLWGLKSPSRAACAAADKQTFKAQPAGFVRRRH